MPDVGVVIPAGGKGLRFPGKIPKQFLLLNGKPMIQRSIELFDSIPSVREIVVVVPRGYISRTKRLVARSGLKKVSAVVQGGKERQHSVWNGLLALHRPPAIVLVHDAARPLTSRVVIQNVIRKAMIHGAAVAGVRTKDTMRFGKATGFYARTVDREKLWAIQTPQGFRYDILMRAHKAARKSRFIGTDEASLVERVRFPVRIVEGENTNIKITTKLDLQLAELLLKR